jgi:uncharacterized membrane protein YphA (DoxX/SURF4 family)
MLNPFPALLDFAILAPFILRITLGVVLIYISYSVIYKKRKDFYKYYKDHKYPFPSVVTWFFGVLNALVGLFFIIGFLTQVDALIAIYLLVSLYLSDKEIGSFQFSGSFYLLASIVAFSLLFLGAGAFAFDIPL